MLSVIIPVLNEEQALLQHRPNFVALRERGAEILVVDGGSDDRSMEIAASFATRVLSAPRGRASQMNAGARASFGTVLLFLHADTVLPGMADMLIENALADPARHWGRFDVRIAPSTPLLRLVAAAMNRRSRLTGIATGDQGIFVRRQTFEAVGAYPDMPLMEDITFSKRLKNVTAPVCLRQAAVTSARRWKSRGIIRTILVMWFLRAAYFLGADTRWLAKVYGYAPRAT